MKNSIRIIAGQFRGRKIHFPDSEALRPTPDRVRETLFNWLSPVIADAKCLDLFAGSGALGFEAVSRGASEVVMIEESFEIAEQLYANRALLKCDHLEIIQQNALEYLAKKETTFDIIFLDPPFHSTLLEESLKLIIENHLLNKNGSLYIEMNKTQNIPDVFGNLRLLKEKKAGQVKYLLCSLNFERCP